MEQQPPLRVEPEIKRDAFQTCQNSGMSVLAMKRKRSLKASVSFILLIVVLSLSRPKTFAQPQDTEVIERFISSQESREKGYLAKGIRTVVRGDLNHDGIPDAVVLYTFEGQNGTNNYVQYLAVFLRVKGQFVPVASRSVGGKHYRSIALKAIKDNVVLFDTLNYKVPTCIIK